MLIITVVNETLRDSFFQTHPQWSSQFLQDLREFVQGWSSIRVYEKLPLESWYLAVWTCHDRSQHIYCISCSINTFYISHQDLAGDMDSSEINTCYKLDYAHRELATRRTSFLLCNERGATTCVCKKLLIEVKLTTVTNQILWCIWIVHQL